MVRSRSIVSESWSDFHEIVLCLRSIIIKFTFHHAGLWSDFRKFVVCLHLVVCKLRSHLLGLRSITVCLCFIGTTLTSNRDKRDNETTRQLRSPPETNLTAETNLTSQYHCFSCFAMKVLILFCITVNHTQLVD